MEINNKRKENESYPEYRNQLNIDGLRRLKLYQNYTNKVLKTVSESLTKGYLINGIKRLIR